MQRNGIETKVRRSCHTSSQPTPVFISNDLDSRVHCSPVTRPQSLPLTQMDAAILYFLCQRVMRAKTFEETTKAVEITGATSSQQQTNNNGQLRLRLLCVFHSAFFFSRWF